VWLSESQRLEDGFRELGCFDETLVVDERVDPRLRSVMSNDDDCEARARAGVGSINM
jgi:hypothetical protein